MTGFKRKFIALVVVGLLAGLPGGVAAGSLEKPGARIGLAQPTEFRGTVTDVFVDGGGCGGGGSLWVEVKGTAGVFYVPLASFDRSSLAELGLVEGAEITVSGYGEKVKDGDEEFEIVAPVSLAVKDKTVRPLWAESVGAKKTTGMMDSGSNMADMMTMMNMMGGDPAVGGGCGDTGPAGAQPKQTSVPVPAQA